LQADNHDAVDFSVTSLSLLSCRVVHGLDFFPKAQHYLVSQVWFMFLHSTHIFEFE